MVDIAPDSLWLTAHVKFDSPTEVLEKLAEFKDIDSLEEFNNQVVDLDTEDPVIAYIDRTDDQENAFRLRPVSEPRAGPGMVGRFVDYESESAEENHLGISCRFEYGRVDILINALLEVIREVEEIEIASLGFDFQFDMDISDMAEIQKISEVTDYTIESIGFSEEGYGYSIHNFEEAGTFIGVFLESDPKDSVGEDEIETYLDTRVEEVIPFINSIIHGE